MNVNTGPSLEGYEQKQEAVWARYRCPVCGHRDRIAIPQATRGDLECSHCDAALEVRGAVDGSESVEVGVRTAASPH
jgi:phage/plasmid primase-like uncharacterized protein